MVRKKPGKKPLPPRKPVVKKKHKVKPFSPGKGNWIFITFFFIFSFILYGNTILNKWAVDDELVTHNEVSGLGLKAIPQIFSSYYITTKGNIGHQTADYRPIVKVTFALENQLLGSEKAGWSHGINILLYFFICTLLFFLLKKLLKNYNILFPFLITVVFMTHPVHTEVVASLKNRDEMLAFLCGIGGLHILLKYIETKSNRFLIYTFIVFIIGYLSKISILPFVVIYPLVLYFFSDVKPKKILYLFFSLMAVVIVAHFLPRFFLPHITRVNSYIENPLYFEKSLFLRLGTGMLSLLFYLRILVVPYPLIYYYGFDMIPLTGLFNIWVFLSAVLHTGLLLFALSKFREKHILSFSILFYLVFISMYANILIPVPGIVAERFVFDGSFGFCIALIYLIFIIFSTDPKSLTIDFSERILILTIVLALVLPSTYYVIMRNRSWCTVYDLYGSDIGHQERSAKSNIQFAGLLMNRVYSAKPDDRDMLRQMYTPDIIRYYKKGLDLYPPNYLALNDLGSVYVNFAMSPDSALIFLKKAVALSPGYQPAWVNMGLSYRKLQKFDSAIYCYQQVLRINPDEVKAVFKIAEIYSDQGNFTKAIQLNEEMMKKYPGLDVPYINIGNYYILHQDTATAVQYWEQAAKKNPSYELCMKLNRLYTMKGDMKKAGYYYNLALEASRKNNRPSLLPE
jgi:protein O-mannosyl-transferase